MLDMDTGGGEKLIELKTHAKTWPERVCAIEGYEPNVAVAKRNLQRIGVKVFQYESRDKLPFKGKSFDLVTNRHGDYSVSEIKRVLRPAGIFITQQIGFNAKISFNRLLGGPQPEYEQLDLADAVSKFEKAGFEILKQQDFFGRDVFDDIGAVVWVLTVAPWELPGFSVERYRDGLYKLHQSIRSNGPINVGIAYFILVVHKPPGA
jgi:SAM-dependent methyltransferase